MGPAKSCSHQVNSQIVSNSEWTLVNPCSIDVCLTMQLNFLSVSGWPLIFGNFYWSNPFLSQIILSHNFLLCEQPVLHQINLESSNEDFGLCSPSVEKRRIFLDVNMFHGLTKEKRERHLRKTPWEVSMHQVCWYLRWKKKALCAHTARCASALKYMWNAVREEKTPCNECSNEWCSVKLTWEK